MCGGQFYNLSSKRQLLLGKKWKRRNKLQKYYKIVEQYFVSTPKKKQTKILVNCSNSSAEGRPEPTNSLANLSFALVFVPSIAEKTKMCLIDWLIDETLMWTPIIKNIFERPNNWAFRGLQRAHFIKNVGTRETRPWLWS